MSPVVVRRLLPLTVVLAALVGAAPAQAIVGGSATAITTVPWQVALMTNWSGGYGAYRCRLSPPDLRSLRRAVDALPLRGRIVRVKPERTGMYVPKPMWVIRAGAHVETFATASRPADAAPFMQHVARITRAHEGHCVRQYMQYR